MEILLILIWICLIWWNVNIAKKNGRNPILAAIWCFFFGLLSIIIYGIMGKSKEQEDKEFALRMSAVHSGQLSKDKK